MCKIGDIIVIEEYKGDDNQKVSKHSFIVIDDTPNEISGLKYDLVTSVMSSFRNNEHRDKKLKYEENVEITSNDIVSSYKNRKSGYIKADQLIYFNKKLIKYYVFAHVSEDLLDELLKIIIKLEVEKKLKSNTYNLESDKQQV